MNACFRDLNLHVQNFMSIKSIDNESLLNRSLSVVCSQYFDTFNTNCEEGCQFFINLYKILSTINKDSDAVWTTISILQQLSKNIEAREAIINQYRFFPLLSNILVTLVNQEKIERLLTLMQDLSYGINITWEEPYLTNLIEMLLREISREDDESLPYLALSVLINICYKNFSVNCLLLKYIRPTNFFQQIKSFGILANKMILVLDTNNNLTTVDLHLFIKQSFTEIEKAIQTWNVPLLKHVVGFLINSKDFIQLHHALTEYENFENDVENLLKSITIRIEIENSNNPTDEHNVHLQNCLSLIYELLNYILETTNSKTQIFPNIIHQIYIFSYNGILSNYAGDKALNLLETIVKNANEDLISLISKDLEILHRVIEISENCNLNKYTTAVQKLLIALLKNTKTQKIVLSIVKESFFNKILQPLLEMKLDILEISTFTVDDLSKYLYCLLVLIEFSNISKTAWIEKVYTTFTLNQIQFVLANGMLSKNELLCNIVFEISKIDYFPYAAVAKIISNLSKVILPHQKLRNINSKFCTCSNNSNNPYLIVSKSCEERLNAIMDKLFNTSRNFDPATSELIELFNYKINLLNTKMGNFTERLINASHEHTQLCHELSLNNIELSKYHSLNYKMQLKYECLQNQIKDLEKQKEISKSGIEEMSKKLKEERLKFKNHAKNMEVKIAEIIELRQQLNKMQLKDEKQIFEIEKLKSISDENSTRIKQLKQSLILTEKELSEKGKIIENKDKEIIKINKIIDELRESLSKNSNLINHLESQIAEKNEKIRSIENELNETEEMRKTILSLMESKKPKRKV